MQGDPKKEAERIRANVAAMQAQGAPPEHIQAYLASVAQKLPPAAATESVAYTGRTPEQAKGDPLKIAGIPARTLAGIGAGVITGGAASALAAPFFGSGLLGAAATGATGNVVGGAASRAIAGEPILSPWMGADALLGGGLGAVARILPTGVEKQTARELAEVLPRVARKGAIAEAGWVAGVTPKEPRVLISQMEAALERADNARFNPIWQTYKQPITDPAVVQQWTAIRETIPKTVSAIEDEQRIALRPVNELLQNIRNAAGQETLVPTLRGVHRTKVLLDRAIAAADRAEAAGTLTSDQSMAIGAIRRASGQLKSLTFQNVPGGREYQAALAASQADRQAIRAVEEGVAVTEGASGALAAKPGTPAAVAERVAAQQSPALSPRQRLNLSGAYREGAVGNLLTVKDPIKRLGDPVVREKVGALLGTTGLRQLESAVNPLEDVVALGHRLGVNTDLGLAGQVGAAEMLGGGKQGAQLFFGSRAVKSLTRKGLLREAQKLQGLLSKYPSSDLTDYEAALKMLEADRVRRARSVAIGTGLLGSLMGQVER